MLNILRKAVILGFISSNVILWTQSCPFYDTLKIQVAVLYSACI